MSVNRDDSGQLKKGSVLNPTGRPRNAYARLLAEIKQKEFVEYFYSLLDKDTAELKRISDDQHESNLHKISARLIYDCMKGTNPKYAEIFLALLGINVKGITNILINNSGFVEPTAEKDATPINHARIMEVIKKIEGEKK